MFWALQNLGNKRGEDILIIAEHREPKGERMFSLLQNTGNKRVGGYFGYCRT